MISWRQPPGGAVGPAARATWKRTATSFCGVAKSPLSHRNMVIALMQTDVTESRKIMSDKSAMQLFHIELNAIVAMALAAETSVEM